MGQLCRLLSNLLHENKNVVHRKVVGDGFRAHHSLYIVSYIDLQHCMVAALCQILGQILEERWSVSGSSVTQLCLKQQAAAPMDEVMDGDGISDEAAVVPSISDRDEQVSKAPAHAYAAASMVGALEEEAVSRPRAAKRLHAA